jgi:hypothetical protein
MEETTDDGETWGKTTARTQGLATQKESWIGTAEWQLADGEYGGGLPRSRGKSYRKEESLAGRSLL